MGYNELQIALYLFPVRFLWAGMYQDGEKHLQCFCGEFDSHSVHRE